MPSLHPSFLPVNLLFQVLFRSYVIATATHWESDLATFHALPSFVWNGCCIWGKVSYRSCLRVDRAQDSWTRRKGAAAEGEV